MEMLGFFAIVLSASVVIGMGLWCASQGTNVTRYLDPALRKGWLIFGLFAAVRALWHLVTEPHTMDEAAAFAVVAAGAGLMATLCFWAGHWRARRRDSASQIGAHG